jgi:hypothetical protein
VGPTAPKMEFGDDVDGGPLGALLVGSIASATGVEEDVNGRPPGGSC